MREKPSSQLQIPRATQLEVRKRRVPNHRSGGSRPVACNSQPQYEGGKSTNSLAGHNRVRAKGVSSRAWHVVTANTTSWKSAKNFLLAAEQDIVMMQETKSSKQELEEFKHEAWQKGFHFLGIPAKKEKSHPALRGSC